MAIGLQVLDERAVDLDLVEAELLQIAEGRIAGAEIVHCDRDTQPAQPTQCGKRFVGLVQQDTFGDLDFQSCRLQSGLLQRALDLIDEAGAAELHG